MMKKLITLMLLACSTAALAQTEIKRFYGYDYVLTAVPQAFTLDGNAIICLSDYYKPESCTILDKDLQEVKTLNFLKTERKQVTERLNEVTGQWEKTENKREEVSVQNIRLNDWRTTYADGEVFMLSQNLFNNDAALEYIVPLYDNNGVTNQEDFNGDGVIDYKVTSYDTMIGFCIASENGSILKTINFGNGIYNDSDELSPTIYLIGNKTYLSVRCYEIDANNKRQYLYLFYSIDRTSNSIKQVAKHKGPSVSPTIADRSDIISVELEEAGAREVQVVNAAGKTVFRVPVKADQREVSIPAHHLSRGVNVVNVIGSKDKFNTKIIVK